MLVVAASGIPLAAKIICVHDPGQKFWRRL